MDPGREAELEAVMGQIAAGDDAAVFALVDRFGDEIGRTVDAIARSRGARLAAEERQELVLDVALDLRGRAASWRPGQAPPWVWARLRVANLVDTHVGQWTRPEEDLARVADVDGDRPSAGSAGSAWSVSAVEVVEALADREPTVALLYEGVRRVASERDVSVYFELLVERAGGNRSPAATVALLHDVPAATVRQQHKRVRTRLRMLAETDERFAALAALEVVA